MVTREPVAFEIPEELAAWEPSSEAVVSCYVDWSVSGRGLHEATTVVRNRLRELLRGVDPRGAARASLEADAARIERYLEEEADPSARGFAIIACHGRGLWWVLTLGVPVTTQVHAGERPLLLPLVEATQDAARTLVALVDTNTARLIALVPSGASELDGPSRAVTTVKHSTKGGWGSLGYQRHVDTETARFAEEVAEAIETTMAARRLHHLVLAGDEVIVPPLMNALSQATRERLDVVEHIDVRDDVEAVAERVWPRVAEVVRKRREAEVESIAGRVAAGIAAAGEPTTVIEALQAGRVDALALDGERVDEAVAELALREALTHRSRVLVVRGHEALASSGGLAATLR
jgi:hypothetical protein